MESKTNLIIVGNGISGTTLARHVRKKSNRPILIISDEHPYFFSRTALMYVYMGHMKFEHTQPYEDGFWEKNNIQLLQDRVVRFNPEKQIIHLENGGFLPYGDLVWAVGSIPNKPGWLGETAKRVQGLYHKSDLEQLENWTPEIEKAVIVGGGLIGIELAEMLRSRGKAVCFLVRENSFWNTVLPAAESEMINQHIRGHGIDLRLNTTLKSITTDSEGAVSGIVTQDGETLSCQYVGLTVGVRPHIDFLRDSDLDCGKGIRVNRSLATNIPHVYAIGDCAEQISPLPGRPSVEAVWYTGRMMGETLAQTLLGQPTNYQPGPWFNSAKFFDIEYQTYGQVSAESDEKNERQWFWQHPTKSILVRWAFRPTNRQLLGVNSMGIRLRHQVLHQWLLEGITVDAAIDQLDHACFDPELTPQYQDEISLAFRSKQNMI